MATIKINFDPAGNPEFPSLILAKRSGEKIGLLGNVTNQHVTDNLNSYSELSFSVTKYVNEQETPYWDEIKNGRLIWCKEWDKWFYLTYKINEDDTLTKEVTCTSLAENELSNVRLYGVEVNTENDIARDDYSPTVLYSSDHSSSLMHRILKNVPAFEITHVDSTIAKIQRTFTFDGVSIYDAFQQISEEIQCLFIFDVKTGTNGQLVRTVAAYDLLRNCLNCDNRDEFDGTTCPKCGSTSIIEPYGEDTNIFFSKEDLAESITFDTDMDSVKNCFKLTAGDDLLTATIINCNPNGSSYIWYLTTEMMNDMSSSLKAKLVSYDTAYKYYLNEYSISLSSRLVTSYNNLINKYKVYNSDLTKLVNPIVGYSNLMNVLYNAIDLGGYLQSTLMPDAKLSDTSASTELAKLTYRNLSPVSVQSIKNISEATAKSAVLAMAKALVDNRYQVKVDSSSLSGTVWRGSFTVTNYSDDEDTATGSSTISVTVNDDYENYISQMIKKTLAKDDTTDLSITGLFQRTLGSFKSEIKKYCLDSLKIFYDSCQGCLGVLIEQGVATEQNKDSDVYKNVYEPYYEKSLALADEIALRQQEIAVVSGKRDSKGRLIDGGVENILTKEKNKINDFLNFEKYLGTTLWKEFTTYRMDDEYSNSNYISDGLTNSQIFDRAREFITVAEKELKKAATPVHTISTDLKNLLIIPRFENIKNQFQVGNWLRVKVDDRIYKLKLLSYSVDYEDVGTIQVTFSDVSDVFSMRDALADVLAGAQSMSKSYDATKRQAETGKKGTAMVSGWVEKGLTATAIKYKNSNNETIVMDSHGLLARNQNPITEEYSDQQAKLVSWGIAFTTDAWRTVKAAVGEFSYWNPISKQKETDYGVIANTLVGNLILSESVGVYNENNSIALNKDGLTITTNGDDGEIHQAFTIQKQTTDDDGNTVLDRQLYVNSDGDLVLNGTLKIFSNGKESDIDDRFDDISNNLDKSIEEINGRFNTVNEYIDNSITNIDATDGSKLEATINQKCEAIKKYSEDQLENYKTTVGQYLTFSGNEGLTIGAEKSDFSTVITNDRMAFKQKDKTVAYISNNQLNIENAIIRSSFVLGHFYWIPRKDGGISVSWIDD